MTSWCGQKCKYLVKLLRRKRPEGDNFGAWENFVKVMQKRAYVGHIVGMGIRLQFFPTLDGLR